MPQVVSLLSFSPPLFITLCSLGGFGSTFGQSGGFASSLNGFSPSPSQRGSPAISARSDALTSAQRKVMADKMDEINLVRQLQS